MALNFGINNVASQIGIKPNPTPAAAPVPTTPPLVTPQPVGTKAKSPALAVPKPSNTLPPAQVAPKDLSATYGRTNDGTIYNKNSQTKFAKPEDFFKDSGVASFDNLKFDNAYTPNGRETIYGQPTPAPTAPPATGTPPPTTTTPPPTTTPYTPPNGGTTGVNQGGIIGNLIGTANSNPNLDKTVSDTQQQIKDLQTNEGNDLSHLPGSGIDLGLATGQTAVIQNKYSNRINALQGLLGTLMTQRGQNIGATSSAGGLNAPIQNPQTGALVTPSTPSTTGITTSGAQNVSSLIGTGDGTNGHPKGEYFNTQTGKGFANPQELSDFINQQVGNPNATNASNVFQQLQSGALNNSGNSALNPLTQIPSLVDSIISGSMTYNDALTRNGTVPNFGSALTAAIKQRDPQFDFINSQASAAAKAANITSAGTAAADAAKSLYLQKYPEAANLYQALKNVDDAGSLTVQNAQGQNINPFQFVPLNTTIADARRYFSSTGQSTFDSNIINLRNLVQNLNASGGGNIPSAITENAQGLIDGTLKMSALQALITAAKQEGQLRFNNSLGAGLKGWNDLQSNGGGGNNNAGSSNNPQGWF